MSSTANAILFYNPVWTVNDLIGQPNSGGKIYFYDSKNPTNFKTVYKDSELTDPWPNPILFDITGAQDDNYPIYGTDDSPYRVVITDINNVPIKTFDPFPSLESGGPNVPDVEIGNQIANGQFKYFSQQSYAPVPASIIGVAPNFDFVKNNTSAIDSLNFVQNIPGQTNVPATPEWYLQYICTGPGSGETQKDLIAYLSDPFAYSGAQMTFSIWGISSSSSPVEIIFVQNFGSLQASAPVLTPLGPLNLTPQWTNQTLTFTVPSIAGKNISPLNDGYTAILVRFPLNIACNIGITNLGLYFGNNAPDYQYQNRLTTLSSVLAVEYPTTEHINSNDGNYSLILKQGQKNLSFQSWAGTLVELAFAYQAGLPYLKCDGSSIYSQQYYNLANAISTNWGIGVNGFYSNSISGLMITVVAAGATTPSQDVNTGMKVYNVVNGSSLNSITQILALPGSEIPNSSYLFFSTTTTNYVFWFNLNGTGVAPVIPGRNAVAVAYTGAETASQIAAKLYTAFSGPPVVLLIPTDTLTVICVSTGNVTPASAGTSDFTVVQIAAGSATDNAAATVQVTSIPVAGTYFLINTPAINYYVWFSQDNLTSDPGSITALAGKVGIKVIFTASDTVAEFLANLAQQLINAQVLLPTLEGMFTRVRANGSSNDPDRNSRTAIAPGANAGDNIGSYQESQNLSHSHDAVAYNVAGGAANRFGTGSGGTSFPVPGVPTDPDGIRESGGNQSNPKNVYVEKVILY